MIRTGLFFVRSGSQDKGLAVLLYNVGIHSHSQINLKEEI